MPLFNLPTLFLEKVKLTFQIGLRILISFQLILAPCYLNAANKNLPKKGSQQALVGDFLAGGVNRRIDDIDKNEKNEQVRDDELLADAARRDAIIGRSTELAMMDPHYTTGQSVSFTNKKNQTINDHFDRLNKKAGTPTSYNLHSDIGVEFNSKQLTLTFDRSHGKVLPVTWQHHFNIPGIKAVLKNELFVHLLLNNGDIRTILFAHTHLFQANELGGGGPLFVPLIGVIPKHLLDERGALPQNVTVRNYDEREKSEYEFDPSVSERTKSQLRQGDLLVVESSNGVHHISNIILVEEMMEALSSWSAAWTAREHLLNHDENPIKVLADLFSNYESKMEGASENVKNTLARMREISSFTDSISGPGLARPLRATQNDWEVFSDLPPFASNYAHLVTIFENVLSDFSQTPNIRSGYSRTDQPELIATGTHEERVNDYLLKNYMDTTDEGMEGKNKIMALALKSSNAVKALLEPKKVGVIGGLSLASYAAWNYASYLLPTVLTDLSYTAHIFGMEMPYVVKAGITIVIITFLLFALPYGMATLSKKVLGRKLSINSDSGWKVWFTLSLRLTVRTMRSWRAAFFQIARMETTAHALRLGVRPKELAKASKTLFKDIPSKEGQLYGLLEHRESKVIASKHVAMILLLEALIQNNKLRRNSKINFTEIFKYLNPEERQIVTQRSEIVAQYIIDRYGDELVLAKPGERTDILEKIRKHDPVISVFNSALLKPLTKNEKNRLDSIRREERNTRLRARLTGHNELFYRFYKGEISDNVARDVLGNEFPTDQITVHPFNLIMYSDMTEPQMLAASDEGVLGVFGIKPLTDWFINALYWVANSPTEELNFTEGKAVHIPDSFYSPEGSPYEGHRRSRIKSRLRASGKSTYSETMAEYAKAYQKANLGKGFVLLGERITRHQIKTWKPMIIIGVVSSLFGYWYDQGFWVGLSALGDNSIMSLYRTLFYTVWAYIGFRIWWMWQATGADYAKGAVQGKINNFSRLILDACELIILEADSLSENREPTHNPAAQKLMERFVALYDQSKHPLPQEITSLSTSMEQLKALVPYSASHPPGPMIHNMPALKTVTYGVGFLTTIIGSYGLKKGWGWGAQADAVTMGAALLGLYAFGKGSIALGRISQAKAYGKLIQKLIVMYKNYNPNSPEAPETMMAMLLEVKDLHASIGNPLPDDLIDFQTLSYGSDLKEAALKLIRFSLSAQPDAFAETKGYNKRMAMIKAKIYTRLLVDLQTTLDSYPERSTGDNDAYNMERKAALAKQMDMYLLIDETEAFKAVHKAFAKGSSTEALKTGYRLYRVAVENPPEETLEYGKTKKVILKTTHKLLELRKSSCASALSH